MAEPAALSVLYTSKEEVESLLSSDGVLLRLDDDQDAANSAGELLRINTLAVNYATARVNLYLGNRYTSAQLATSWSVHDWATMIAARWVCRRRTNPVPESLQDAYDEAIAEMTAIRDRLMSLTDIQERQADQPVLSNMTLDGRYKVKQLRKQLPISTPRPTVAPSPEHYPSTIIGGLEDYR